jgi:hypothetical protein
LGIVGAANVSECCQVVAECCLVVEQRFAQAVAKTKKSFAENTIGYDLAMVNFQYDKKDSGNERDIGVLNSAC